MGQLRRLHELGQLPDDLEPLIDSVEAGGNGEIYGVAVMTSPDGRHRADIIEYPRHWAVLETGLPGGEVAARSWKYSRSTSLEDVVARIREWGVNPATSPEGWFDERHLSDALLYLVLQSMLDTES